MWFGKKSTPSAQMARGGPLGSGRCCFTRSLSPHHAKICGRHILTLHKCAVDTFTAEQVGFNYSVSAQHVYSASTCSIAYEHSPSRTLTLIALAEPSYCAFKYLTVCLRHQFLLLSPELNCPTCHRNHSRILCSITTSGQRFYACCPKRRRGTAPRQCRARCPSSGSTRRRGRSACGMWTDACARSLRCRLSAE